MESLLRLAFARLLKCTIKSFFLPWTYSFRVLQTWSIDYIQRIDSELYFKLLLLESYRYLIHLLNSYRIYSVSHKQVICDVSRIKMHFGVCELIVPG